MAWQTLHSVKESRGNPLECNDLPCHQVKFVHKLSLTERLKPDVVVMLDVIVRLATTKHS